MLDPNKKIKVVFTCLDWRLHPQIESFFSRNGAGCDMCVTAGSVKALINPGTQAFLLEQAGISLKLHNCQAVVLTMHLDCGAYGGSASYGNAEKEMAACVDQLNAAKDIISKHYPELPIESYIIGLEHSDGGWVIKPQAVDI